MQESPLTNAIVRQWLALLPAWGIFLAGMVVALVYWRHCPRPALLTLLAMVLLGLTAAVQPVATTYLITLRGERAWTVAEFNQWSLALVAAINAVRAVAYGLLLWAVFTGRRAPGPVHPATLPTDPGSVRF